MKNQFFPYGRQYWQRGFRVLHRKHQTVERGLWSKLNPTRDIKQYIIAVETQPNPHSFERRNRNAVTVKRRRFYYKAKSSEGRFYGIFIDFIRISHTSLPLSKASRNRIGTPRPSTPTGAELISAPNATELQSPSSRV